VLLVFLFHNVFCAAFLFYLTRMAF
jgi:hypothetical protein